MSLKHFSNQSTWFPALALMLMLHGCEGGTTFTKIFDNRSSETITIQVYSLHGNENPITIAPGVSKEIYWYDKMGLFAGDDYQCTDEIDSVKISITNDKTLTKDIQNPNQWIRESSDGRKATEKCTFIVADSDLQ
jgi:uncharacterized protein YcfL